MMYGSVPVVPCYGTRGVVASCHPLAARAALEAFSEGGNAVDAALAAVWVEMVVLPMATGIGGDVIVLLWDRDRPEPEVLLAIGRGPWAPHPRILSRINAGGLPRAGLLSASLPAAVKGLETIRRSHASLPRAAIMRRAIGYAQDGFPLSERASALTARASLGERGAHALLQWIGRQGGFEPGTVWRQPELAHILGEVEERGAPGFYEGTFRQRLLEVSQAEGGWFSVGDFELEELKWTKPLMVRHKGGPIFSTGFPSAGDVVMLAQLVIDHLGGAGEATPDDIERMIMSRRLALAHRLEMEHTGFWQDKPNVRSSLVERLAHEVPGAWTAGDGGTSLAVAMDDTRQIAIMHSLSGVNYGSGLMVPGTGVILNSRFGRGMQMTGFQAGARPLSTLNLIAAQTADFGRIVGGTPGGDQQTLWNLQFLNRTLSGDAPECAVSRPRWFDEPDKPRSLVFEKAFDPVLIHQLSRRGWETRTIPQATGGYQFVVNHPRGFYAVSDPRIQGGALGL